MILQVYAIFDNKAKVFSRPFFLVSDGVAVRSFSQLANDPSTEIGRHSTDFSLHRLGTFDDALGTFDDPDGITNLGLAAQFKEVKNAS